MSNSLNDALAEMFSLQDKRVFIWGVGGVLGSAITREFCRLGARVSGVSLNQIELQQAEAAAHDTAGSYLGGARCDITKPDQLLEGADFAKRIFAGEPIDICLVVAGGVGYVIGAKDKFHEGDIQKWTETVELNYLAPVHAVMKTIPLMLNAPSPIVGLICSMSYEGHLSRTGAYRGAKRALHDFVYWLTPELSKLGSKWRVLGWQPGFVLSEQNRKMLEKDQSRMDAVTGQLPRGEWQQAQPIAQGIVGSCTPAFSELHGAVIPLAAGFPCAGLGMKVL